MRSKRHKTAYKPGIYDVSYETVLPQRFLQKMRTKQHAPTSFESQTDYRLWVQLTSSSKLVDDEKLPGGSMATLLLHWGDGYYVQVQIHNDDDGWAMAGDEFGKVHACRDSYDGLPVRPEWDTEKELVYVDQIDYDYVWLEPGYPIAERFETLHNYGVNKHDALLMARNWAQMSADRLRGYYHDEVWSVGYVLKVYYSDDQEIDENDVNNETLEFIDEDSCWGYWIMGDDDWDYLDIEISSQIGCVVSYDKPIRAAANSYAYA